jgi:hypothetical protein
MASVLNAWKYLNDALIVVLGLLVSLVLIEGLLRLKNANQMNYTIEMWRCAKALKVKGFDPLMGYEHRTNTSAGWASG